jgi:protein-S-isoprenylcysteine O-methyltransferase Ste14
VRHPFRRKNLNVRLLPFYAAVVLGFVLARPTPLGLAVGGALVLSGVALRGWGGGHLVKNDRLTVSGPYAHLRHPLYAGTLLLGSGFAVMAGPWGVLLLFAFFLPVFFLYYLPYKDRIESARLERRYGLAFASYRAAVPALLPSMTPWSPPSDLSGTASRRWSQRRFRANGELANLAGVGLALGLLALRMALFS